jgi:hypothetical protein
LVAARGQIPDSYYKYRFSVAGGTASYPVTEVCDASAKQAATERTNL